MTRSLIRLLILVIFVAVSPRASRASMLNECAEVGQGCEATCTDFCGERLPLLLVGCGCPTLGTYGSSCDCWCFGDPARAFLTCTQYEAMVLLRPEVRWLRRIRWICASE